MRCLLWHLISLCGVSVVLSTTDVTKHPNWPLFESKRCGNSNSDRIIGGKNASLGAYPWIARIGYSEPGAKGELTYRCGGSLINQLYVLTAAHCAANLPNNLKISGIRLGEHNTLTDIDCVKGYCAEPVQDFEPESVIVHENYNNPPYRHDIALIRLSKPVVYNDHVKPICMVYGELLEKIFHGETAEVAGWGIYDISDPKPSTTLLTVTLPIVEEERCARAFKKFANLTDTQMCVGGVVGQDSCGGDSGGPLMKVISHDGRFPRYYLLGVVSFGATYCGSSTTPAVYSIVAKYMTWILDHMSP